MNQVEWWYFFDRKLEIWSLIFNLYILIIPQVARRTTWKRAHCVTRTTACEFLFICKRNLCNYEKLYSDPFDLVLIRQFLCFMGGTYDFPLFFIVQKVEYSRGSTEICHRTSKGKAKICCKLEDASEYSHVEEKVRLKQIHSCRSASSSLRVSSCHIETQIALKGEGRARELNPANLLIFCTILHICFLTGRRRGRGGGRNERDEKKINITHSIFFNSFPRPHHFSCWTMIWFCPILLRFFVRYALITPLQL